jgi:hypothetical protein
VNEINPSIAAEPKPLTLGAGFPRICRLRDEYYDFLSGPEAFIDQLRRGSVKADIFTFIQEIHETTPRFPQLNLEWDSATALRLTTFDHWWKKQINDKTRNMVRKAQKNGVELRQVDFDDVLLAGIHVIYNESPVRQGRPFKHFGKDLDTLRQEHATFLDRSEFYGAFHQGTLIGFIKLVHGRGVSNLMNIISMIAHRDKAPTNALIAKAVEVCTQRNVPILQYGTGNHGSIGEFKKHSAFEEILVPRYYVALNWRGSLALRLRLHRKMEDRIPAPLRQWLLQIRNKWNNYRLNAGSKTAPLPNGGQRAQA